VESTTDALRELSPRQLQLRGERSEHEFELPAPCDILPLELIEPLQGEALLTRQRGGEGVLTPQGRER